MADPTLVQCPADLLRLAERLEGASAVALDLEGDNQHGFGDRVCLVQLATEDAVGLVDTLAVTDLSPLSALLTDGAVRKVVHDASNDLRQLHDQFGLEVRSLFDTMVASRLAGCRRVGLADMLADTFGVALDKRFQRANWRQRPLPPAMLAYAAEDTTHLLALAARLEGRLRRLGRLSWLEEECRRIEGLRLRVREGPLVWEVSGTSRLSPRQLGVLEELLAWRRAEARRRDQPEFKIVATKVLVDVAWWMPQNDRELALVASLPERLRARWGRALAKAVDRGLALADEALPGRAPRPVRSRLTKAARLSLRRLKAWRLAASERLGLDPAVLIGNAALEAVAAAQPGSREDLAALGELRAWQVEALGDEILSLLAARA